MYFIWFPLFTLFMEPVILHISEAYLKKNKIPFHTRISMHVFLKAKQNKGK